MRILANAWLVHMAERERREQRPDAEMWFAMDPELELQRLVSGARTPEVPAGRP
jgi:hypothetical protein